MNSVPLALTVSALPRLTNDCAPTDGLIAGLPPTAVEDDCAPVDSPSLRYLGPAPNPTQPAVPYHLTPQLYTDTLPHGFTLVFGPYSPAGPVVLNQPAWTRLQAFGTPRPVEEAVDFTLAAQNLILPKGHSPNMTPGRPTTLTAWLHVTNACNLDCPYCYIRKSNVRMSPAVGRQVIEAIFRTAQLHGFQTVKLKYAGGEAALHFELVRQLHHYAQRLAQQTGKTLRAVVLSNGTVWTRLMACQLAEAGIRLMISLDGVGPAHNAVRPLAGGGGSFARLAQTVDDILLPAGIRPDIAVTVTGQNAHAAGDAVAWAIARDLPFSLNFYRDVAWAKDRAALKLEETKIIAGMRRAYQVIAGRMPAAPFLNGLLDRVQFQSHTHTCGVGQNYLVFSHAGHVAQCQMHLGQARPLTPNGDALQQTAQEIIPIISVEEKSGCRECRWRFRCTGGCPLETYRATGRFDGPSPHCKIYRTLFPEALRLEGLRLLAQAGY